jgi:hypothetical protein
MSSKLPVSIGPIKSDPLLAHIGITREQVIRLTAAHVTAGRIAAADDAETIKDAHAQ